MKRDNMKECLQEIKPTEFQKNRMLQQVLNKKTTTSPIPSWTRVLIILPVLMIGLWATQFPLTSLNNQAPSGIYQEVIRKDTLPEDTALIDIVNPINGFKVDGQLYEKTDVAVDEIKMGTYLFTIESSNEELNHALVYQYGDHQVLVQQGNNLVIYEMGKNNNLY